jgi:ectoine hydroxylase-related dioxygenase (phytanoyl-CoA dioxygenase family)
MNSIEQLENNGFVIIENLISENECDAFKLLLEEYSDKYKHLHARENPASVHGLNDKSMEKVVYNLHNKSIEWFKLFCHPEVLLILDKLLMNGSYKDSEPYYMNNNSARNPLLGNPGQQLHSDSRLPGINYCIVANVLWMIDDFTITNGATRVVPGSHKFMQFAEDGKKYDEEILVTGKRGSALIFNANLWHGGGPNFDGSSRWAIALGYARWFIKPAFDYMLNTPTEVYDQLSDKQKEILGFNCIAPKDEFTRVRRRSDFFEKPFEYKLPK